jgi:hypothetical protein
MNIASAASPQTHTRVPQVDSRLPDVGTTIFTVM